MAENRESPKSSEYAPMSAPEQTILSRATVARQSENVPEASHAGASAPVNTPPRAPNPAANATSNAAASAERVRTVKTSAEMLQRQPPILLKQAMYGEIELIPELALRYPQMPVMSLVHTRETGTAHKRGVALVATQDNAASLIIEIDGETKAAQFTYTTGAMIGARFLPRPNETDRAHWLDGMRRASGEPMMLWSASRWEHDYLVCESRRAYSLWFAFSGQSEAAARMTGEVTRRLIDWMAGFWRG